MCGLEAAITHALEVTPLTPLTPLDLLVAVLLSPFGGVAILLPRLLHTFLGRRGGALLAAVAAPGLARSAVEKAPLAAFAGSVEEDVPRHLARADEGSTPTWTRAIISPETKRRTRWAARV